MGVKSETADMTYHNTKSSVKALEWELKPYPPTLKNTTRIKIDKLFSALHKRPDGSQMTGEEVFESIWGKDIPAWSLSRLISMFSECIIVDSKDYMLNTYGDFLSYSHFENGDHKEDLVFVKNKDIFLCLISLIDWLIKNNHFNKEYLK